MLAADALITVQQQADLLVRYQAYIDTDRTLRDASVALDVRIADSSISAPRGHAADVFGDGRIKPVSECVMPGGRTPRSLIRPDGQARKKIRVRIRNDPSLRRVEPGVLADMRSAEALHAARESAIAPRNAAAHALNSRINALMFSVPCKAGFAIDVFGDGTVKPVAQILLPHPLVRFSGTRFTA